jgi:hypothetical protein
LSRFQISSSTSRPVDRDRSYSSAPPRCDHLTQLRSRYHESGHAWKRPPRYTISHAHDPDRRPLLDLAQGHGGQPAPDGRILRARRQGAAVHNVGTSDGFRPAGATRSGQELLGPVDRLELCRPGGFLLLGPRCSWVRISMRPRPAVSSNMNMFTARLYANFKENARTSQRPSDIAGSTGDALSDQTGR